MNKIVTAKVSKIWSTPDSRKAIAIAGRVCYTSMSVDRLQERLTDEEISKMVTKLLENRHTSTFRHASFMFAISGVSRAFSHQLVRHTAGNAFEQRSQHYRTEQNFSVTLPDSVPEELKEKYLDVMKSDEEFYEELIAAGVPKEDARMVLPNACETVLVWTANLEAVINFCKARACRLNNYEILTVAAQVRRLVLAEFPEMRKYLGPTCWTQGICFEGQRYYDQCNKPWKDAVLWSEDFPQEIEFISTDKSKERVTNVMLNI